MQPEYFLNRIREFEKKNGRPPRSDDFNGPFHKNIMKHFGSWQKAIDAALHVKVNYGRKSDAELLKEISDFVLANKRIPNHSELRNEQQLSDHFGSYAAAIETAIGFNPQTAILRALQQLTLNTSYASHAEIASEMQRCGDPITQPQIRGLLSLLGQRGLVDVRRGDRIRLYRLTSEGRKMLKKEDL